MMVLDSFRLDGRHAVVTGAGSGLGRAMAIALAEAGATLSCLDVDEVGAQATVSEIVSAGGRALSAQVNVADSAEVVAAFTHVAALQGPVEILVNNAGVSSTGKKIHELPESEWHRRMAINLDSIFLTSGQVIPAMMERRWGRIINTASMWGNLGSRKHPLSEYAAAKGGVINLTREMAMQYAEDGILVNAIAPGFFRTNLTSRYSDPDWVATTASSVPLGRCAEAVEIGGLVVFLASPASSYITGQTLTIDGGFSSY